MLCRAKKGQSIKAAHGMDDQEAYPLQITITAEGVLHLIRKGDKWETLDNWKPGPEGNLGGKFGFYLPGKDQVGFSNFSFKSQ